MWPLYFSMPEALSTPGSRFSCTLRPCLAHFPGYPRCGPWRTAYAIGRGIRSAARAAMPNIRWHIALALPRTRTVGPPTRPSSVRLPAPRWYVRDNARPRRSCNSTAFVVLPPLATPPSVQHRGADGHRRSGYAQERGFARGSTAHRRQNPSDRRDWWRAWLSVAPTRSPPDYRAATQKSGCNLSLSARLRRRYVTLFPC